MALTLSFAVSPLPHHPDVLAFVPVLDDVPLTARIDEFEAAEGMEPRGDAHIRAQYAAAVQAIAAEWERRD